MSLKSRTRRVQYRAGSEELARLHAIDYLAGNRSWWFTSRLDHRAVRRLKAERERQEALSHTGGPGNDLPVS